MENQKNFNQLVKNGLIEMIELNKKQISQNLAQLENIKVILIAIEQRENQDDVPVKIKADLSSSEVKNSNNYQSKNDIDESIKKKDQEI